MTHPTRRLVKYFIKRDTLFRYTILYTFLKVKKNFSLRNEKKWYEMIDEPFIENSNSNSDKLLLLHIYK